MTYSTRSMQRACFVLALLLLSACTRTAVRDESTGGYNVVRVIYGTDRNARASTDPDKAYGSSRDELSFGACEVSIPWDHRIGELESPAWWQLEFHEDPAQHVSVLSYSRLTPERFGQQLRIATGDAGRRHVLLFIHGYNVSFVDAARRTAQLAYDLQFKGVPIFYSWPSRAKTSAYTVDEQTIEWSRENLRRFVVKVMQDAPDARVTLLAHSMGNRALAYVLTRLAQDEPALLVRLDQVIMAAPDIDAEVFRRDIAPAFASLPSPATLYASSRDAALQASHGLHGMSRLGDVGPGGVVVVAGMESIDASAARTDFIGHSYFGDDGTVIADLHALLNDRRRAAARSNLVANGAYWVLRP